MSISPLSSNLISNLSEQSNPFQQIRQDFKQLASSLQSGNLTDAQSAYSSIQQILQANQGSSVSNSSASGSGTLQNDFAAVGQALESGDLSQAQSAFAQLQSDFQASRQSQSGAWAQGPTQSGDQYVSSQSQNPVNEALQDYSQLATSLQSGNLAGAQSAYSNLQQLVQEFQGSSSSGSTTIQSDFSTLGQDLQSGNLTGAQSAFSQLQTDLGTAQQSGNSQAQKATQPQKIDVKGHHGHHRHGGGGYASETSSSSSSTTSSSTTGSSVNVYG